MPSIQDVIHQLTPNTPGASPTSTAGVANLIAEMIKAGLAQPLRGAIPAPQGPAQPPVPGAPGGAPPPGPQSPGLPPALQQMIQALGSTQGEGGAGSVDPTAIGGAPATAMPSMPNIASILGGGAPGGGPTGPLPAPSPTGPLRPDIPGAPGGAPPPGPTSGVNPIVQQIINALGSGSGGATGLPGGRTAGDIATPAPAPPAAPPPGPSPGTGEMTYPSPTAPTIGGLGASPSGTGTTFNIPGGTPYPGPPQFPGTPPQMGNVVGLDPSEARRFAEEGTPKVPDYGELAGATTANILGGWAGGAASVDPTSAGSFARALGMAGAGGAKAQGAGAEKMFEAENAYDQRRSQYAMGRSNQELGIARDAAAVGNAQRVVDYQNKKAGFDDTRAQAQAQHDYQVTQHNGMAPRITHTANGVIIEQPQADGSTNVTVHDVGATAKTMEDVYKYGKEMSGLFGDKVADPLLLDFVRRSFPNNPQLQHEMIQRHAIWQAVSEGLGSQAWGSTPDSVYGRISATVDRNMKADPTFQNRLNMSGEKGPQMLKEERDRQIAAALYTYFTHSGTFPESMVQLKKVAHGIWHSDIPDMVAGSPTPSTGSRPPAGVPVPAGALTGSRHDTGFPTEGALPAPYTDPGSVMGPQVPPFFSPGG